MALRFILKPDDSISAMAGRCPAPGRGSDATRSGSSGGDGSTVSQAHDHRGGVQRLRRRGRRSQNPRLKLAPSSPCFEDLEQSAQTFEYQSSGFMSDNKICRSWMSDKQCAIMPTPNTTLFAAVLLTGLLLLRLCRSDRLSHSLAGVSFRSDGNGLLLP